MKKSQMQAVVSLPELQSILEEHSYHRALQRAVEVIARVVPSSTVTIMFLDARKRLHFEAWANIAQSVIKSAERSFNEALPRNVREILRTKKPAYIEDLSSYDDWREPVASTRSWVGFPVLLRGRVIAVINVQTIDLLITPETVDSLKPVIHIITLIVLRYQEQQELREHNKYLRILYQMALEKVQQSDLQITLRSILELISHILGYDHADILVYDEGRHALVFTANHGRSVERIGKELDVLEQRGVTVRAFQLRKSVIVHDTLLDRGFIQGLWPARSELAMPLLAGGRCVGVVDLESSEVGAFTRSDVRLLTPFVTSLGLLIDNYQKTQQLHEQATHDGLTGFLNRYVMDDLITAEIQRAERHHRDISVAMLDLDEFKRINDQLGHSEGDRILRVFAACIRGTVRVSDLVFRYGGDEFLIILPETSVEQARSVLSRLAATPSPGLQTSLGRVTFSAGIASYRGDPGVRDLVRLADDRLYASKRRGRSIITCA